MPARFNERRQSVGAVQGRGEPRGGLGRRFGLQLAITSGPACFRRGIAEIRLGVQVSSGRRVKNGGGPSPGALYRGERERFILGPALRHPAEDEDTLVSD